MCSAAAMDAALWSNHRDGQGFSGWFTLGGQIK